MFGQSEAVDDQNFELSVTELSDNPIRNFPAVDDIGAFAVKNGEGVLIPMRHGEEGEGFARDEMVTFIHFVQIEEWDPATEHGLVLEVSCALEDVGKLSPEIAAGINGRVDGDCFAALETERTKIIHAVSVIGMVVRNDDRIERGRLCAQ